MKTKTLVCGVASMFVLLSMALSAAAMPRRAASKIQGNYNFDAARNVYPAPSGATAAAATDVSAERSFSYAPATPRATDAARATQTPPAPAPRAVAPSPSVRRYSYQPSLESTNTYYAPRRSTGYRGWDNIIRSADSKIRGDY
jgi:hypothetical protein